jgi:hypothetical protein
MAWCSVKEKHRHNFTFFFTNSLYHVQAWFEVFTVVNIQVEFFCVVTRYSVVVGRIFKTLVAYLITTRRQHQELGFNVQAFLIRNLGLGFI